MPAIEDMIYQRWDEERARATAFSFAPIYQFLSAVAHLARMDERQAIVDLVREARQPGRGKNWNAGYDAALTAMMQAAVDEMTAEQIKAKMDDLFAARACGAERGHSALPHHRSPSTRVPRRWVRITHRSSTVRQRREAPAAASQA